MSPSLCSYGAPPSKDEYEKYWKNVFQKNEQLGNKMALQAVLIYVTLTPEFVYRMELGLGESDEHGRRFSHRTN